MAADRKTVFTLRDAQAVFEKGYGYLRFLLHSLARKGWVERVKQGVYVIVPLEVPSGAAYTEEAFLIAARLLEPSYLSYGTALTHYRWTEQPSAVIYSATTKPTRRFEVHGVGYYYARVTSRKFFGYREQWVGATQVKIAEREKALIDAFDRLDLCGGVVEAFKSLAAASKEINWETLLEYGLRASNRSVLKRIGYLAERDGLAPSLVLRTLQKEISRAYALLDPGRMPTGRILERWKLRVNISDRELDGWKGA